MRPESPAFVRREMLAIFWLVAMFSLSSIPGSYLPSVGLLGVDKVFHFSFFALGSLFMWQRFPCSGWHLSTRWLVLFVVMAGLAVTDEMHQLYTPDRTCSVEDYTADVTGAFVALVLCSLFQFFRKRPATR